MEILKSEIVIVGQGLAGSLLVWELWQKGISFLVFDPCDGRSSSQAAGGLFYPLAARKLKMAEMADVQVPFMIERFHAIENILQKRFLFEKPSLKLISPDSITEWETASENNLSHIIREIRRGIRLKGVKTGFAGVVIEPSGYVDVPGFIESTRKWLINHNLLVRDRVNYKAIFLSDEKVNVNGYIEAQRIIFCEGPSAVYNPWFPNTDIRMNKGELMEIHAPGLQEDFILRESIFILPIGNLNFKVGSTYKLENHDYLPTDEGLAELSQKLERIIDVPYKITGHWAGIRPTTRDRMPIIGPHSEYPQIVILNGLGSRGVLQGPWCADLLCEWLLSGIKEWPFNIDVARFNR